LCCASGGEGRFLTGCMYEVATSRAPSDRENAPLGMALAFKAVCSASRAICPRLGALWLRIRAIVSRSNTILLASSQKAPILPLASQNMSGRYLYTPTAAPPPAPRVVCTLWAAPMPVDGGVRPSYRPLRPVGGPSAVSQRACSATISSHPRRPARILAGICDRGTAASPHACAVAARGLVGEVHFVTIDAPQIKALGVVAEGGGGGGRFAGHDRLRAAHQPTHRTARPRHVPGGSEPCWVGP